ncbi:hypothetical protein [Nannocystis pusilla]|uniref:hypothetical protein n=1 Tax=Nannocystis pusilla TaxID=889268 RepID=UPI003B7E8258
MVTRTSGVLETRTRTLRVEIEVPGDESVLPGSFVYARLQVPRARPVPMIPASALVVRKEGTLVAKVSEGAVTLVPVKLGRDLGKEIEVLEGWSPATRWCSSRRTRSRAGRRSRWCPRSGDFF